jgi:hypothetical protein
MADGYDKRSAIAICHDSIMGKGVALWQDEEKQMSVLQKVLGNRYAQ